MGVLAPKSAHARPSAQPPIDTNNKRFAARVWEWGSKKLVNVRIIYPKSPKVQDLYAKKIPLMAMGGRAAGLACADLGARTPIGVSGISIVAPSPRATRC